MDYIILISGFKDDAGLWSSTISQFIIKQPPSVSLNKQIVEYEYWFDNGYAQKITETVAPQSLLQLDTGLNTASLNPGLHSFKIRFKDNSGLWSGTVSQFIFKRSNATIEANVITAYRYWFDMKDAAITTVQLPFPTNPYLLVTKINVTALDTGFHSVHFQFRDTNNLWSLATIDTFYQVGEPSLNAILPNNGGNTGDVTVNISGNGFFPGTSVKLTRAGQADIVVPDSLMLINKFGISMRATFDLHGADTGTWNVVVTVPNDTVMTLVDGFRVDSGSIQQPIVSIIGFNSIRLNQWQTYTLVCSNPGNVNAKGVPVWLAIPHNASIEFDIKFFPLKDSSINYDTLAKFVTVDTVQFEPFHADVYSLFIPNIAPNSVFTFSFKLKVSNTSNFKLQAWANPPFYGSPLKYLVGECWDNIIGHTIGVIPVANCVYGLLDLGLSPYFDYYHTGVAGFNDEYMGNLFLNVVETGLNCTTFGSEAARTALDFIIGGIDDYELVKSCATNLSQLILESKNINTVASFDPNEKIGPAGTDSRNYYRDNVPYPYVIHFENVDSATGSAQTVLITDTLDLDVFDINTLELGFIKIGDTVFRVPAGLKAMDEYFDLRPKQNIILKARAGFNETTGVLSWEFTALDPLTYEQVLNPEVGFLPPNKTAPEGEGSVFYTIRLKDSLAHGTAIANRACIYFDNNPSICTNKWTNTIDNIKPASKVDSLISPTKGISFTVNWSGIDTGSGIKNYSIYYSVNSGAYITWIVNTSATSAVFSGMIDSTYRFYSVALDSAGNYEPTTFAPDAMTTVKSDFKWIGVNSIDWNTASNWSGGVVPTANDDVTIPANTPYSANIPLGITVSCKSVTILPGAVVIVGENAHLNVMH